MTMSSSTTTQKSAFVLQGVPLSKTKRPALPRATPRPPHHARHLQMAVPVRTRVHAPRCTTRGVPENMPTPTQKVQVQIEAPGRNCRKISACNLINAPLATVWSLLTDYSKLSDHIPNLVISERIPHARGIRVEQSGAQKIFGFEFRASLVMNMTEVTPTSSMARAIDFSLHSSSDFRDFEGTWGLISVGESKTALYYSVTIVPKGLVPVRAIEWRISEDVPENMDAVRMECERRRRISVASAARAKLDAPRSKSQPPQ